MEIIKDTKNLLRLRPLDIYFMLPAEGSSDVAEHLKQLNRYKTMTRGSFRFHVVTHSDTFNNDLPPEIINALSNHNMMMRLLNDTQGNSYYALHLVDFHQAPDSVDDSIKSFITKVCQENIKHLKDSKDPISTKLEDKFNSLIIDDIKRRRLNRPVWDRIVNPTFRNNLTSETTLDNNAIDIFRPDDLKEILMRRYLKSGVSSREANETIEDILKEYQDYPNRKESDETVEAMISPEDDTFLREKCERENYDKPSNITAIIKLVETGRNRKNKPKKGFGVEITLNDKSVQVYFATTDQLVVYAATLMSVKEGHYFGSKSFIEEIEAKSDNVVWLGKIYKMIYNYLYKYIETNSNLQNRQMDTFNIWFNKKRNKKNAIFTAKSGANRTLWDALKNESKAAYHYCYIKSREDSPYIVQLTPEEIVNEIIPQ